jgi:hypothetical protein
VTEDGSLYADGEFISGPESQSDINPKSPNMNKTPSRQKDVNTPNACITKKFKNNRTKKSTSIYHGLGKHELPDLPRVPQVHIHSF